MFVIVTFHNEGPNQRTFKVSTRATRYPNIFMFEERVALDESQLRFVASALNSDIEVLEIGNDTMCILRSGKTMGLYGVGADVEYTIHDLDTPDHNYVHHEFRHSIVSVNNNRLPSGLVREINKQDYGNEEGTGPQIRDIVEASDMSGVPCDVDGIYTMGLWDMSKMMDTGACCLVRNSYGRWY